MGDRDTSRGASDDGAAVKGSFSEAAGLESEAAAVDYRTGSGDRRLRKIPGVRRLPTIVLKRSPIALGGAGTAAAGVVLTLAGLFGVGNSPTVAGTSTDAPRPVATASPSPSSATASPRSSPTAGASPAVTGSTTGNAAFTKVSGPCNFARQWTDRYSFVAKDGTLTLTQLSNSHATTGRIEPSGSFSTSSEGQTYSGTVRGTSVQGRHAYTADGCNEIYDFTMQLSGPLVAPGGTASGASPVPTTGAGAATATPSAIVVPTLVVSDPSTVTATAGAVSGGPNLPLSGLGVLVILAGVGMVLYGPRLIGGAGGPVFVQKDAEADPCDLERRREAAACARRDAADARLERISPLFSAAREAGERAETAARAEADAKRGASSAVVDGRTIYTNPERRAAIEAAEAAAREARAAADAAQRAFDGAGGIAEMRAAEEAAGRAMRDWEQADAALRACLKLFAPSTPGAGATGGGAGTGPGTGTGTTTGGAVTTGTGTDDGTRTRQRRECDESDPPRNETSSDSGPIRFYDIGNAEIQVDGTRLMTDQSHARGFLAHLGTVEDTFGNVKMGASFAQGEVVGGVLDAVEFPDFFTYFGKITERLEAGMDTLLDALRRYNRWGFYTVKVTEKTYVLTCRRWQQCENGAWVSKREVTMRPTGSSDRNSRDLRVGRDDDIVNNDGDRRRVLDRIFSQLSGFNTRAERAVRDFESNCR